MHGDYLPVAFIGSGVSVNYQDWYAFIEEIAELGGNEAGLNAIRAQAGNTLDLESLLMIADDALDDIDTPSLIDFLRNKFAATARLPSVFNAIVRAPFAFYITTNYDSNIEEAYQNNRGRPLRVVLPDRIEDALIAMRDDEPFILKIHGCARSGSSCVIGHEDYRNTIYNNRHLRYVLAAILATRPIVFVGYGHRDPHITRYLDYERSILPRPAMQRFAFMRRDDKNLAIGSYLRRLNIARIELDKWGDIEDVLDQCTFLRMRDRYQRGRREFFTDFLSFVNKARVECTWGALMYAYASSDLGHADDIKKILDTIEENAILRTYIESTPSINLAFRIVAGQMFKRAHDPAAAAVQFEKAEFLAGDNDRILIPLRALGLRYAGIFYLRPSISNAEEFRDVSRSRSLFNQALYLLGEEFPEERLDVEKWEAHWIGDVGEREAAIERLLDIAARADTMGYRKNAAWCRYGAAEQALLFGGITDPVKIKELYLPQIEHARADFEELQHPRGLGMVHYLRALAMSRLPDSENSRVVTAIHSHLTSAMAMAAISGDARLRARCSQLSESVPAAGE